MSRAGRVAWVALWPWLASCASTPLFPDLGPITDGDVLRVLRARTCRTDPLVAAMTISYDGPEANGTFDAVGIWAPRLGALRVQAYKDLVFTIEPIFDLVFTPDAYGMEMRGEGDAPPEVAHGAAGDFVHAHADLAMFFWVREAFCLPGALGTGEAQVLEDVADPDGLVIESVLSSGAHVQWFAARRTLQITRAEVSTPDGVLVGALDYRGGYRSVGGVLIPRTAVYRDASRTIEFELGDADFDLEVEEAGVLEPEDVGVVEMG